jgi:hypothetical protein
MKQVTPFGYFCLSCMTTLTLLDEGWVHILTPDFREKRVREESLS